jgi:hypothetical protein
VRECSDLEYVSIAKVEMEIGKVVCDRGIHNSELSSSYSSPAPAISVKR